MAVQAAPENNELVSTYASGVVTVTINRPSKKNAVSQAMWLELAALFGRLGADQAVRAIVLRGAGADFSAGADIGEFDAVRGDGERARRYEAANAAAFAAIRDVRCPVIAAIRGICYGGGFGIAAACDLRFATPEARFAVPAARLGLAYPVEAMPDIVHALGPQMARYLAFTAATIGAEEALAAGFLLEIVGPEALDEKVAEVAAAIAANAPLSIRASKASIAAVLSGDPKAAARAAELGAATFDSHDYAEGRAAFRDRRKPVFKGL